MQKYVNLVDLVKSFHTSISLQKRLRYNENEPLKVSGGSIHLVIRLLGGDAAEQQLRRDRRTPVEYWTDVAGLSGRLRPSGAAS